MRRTIPIIALAALALAACGGADEDVAAEDPGGAGSGASTAPSTGGDGAPTVAGPAGGASVTVSFWVEGRAGGAAPAVYALTCGDPMGVSWQSAEAFAVDAAAACGALAAGADALAPPAADMACTMLYGGPQELTIVGTIAGAPVDAAISRADGCQIARWDALAALAGDAPVGVEPPAASTGPDAPVASDDPAAAPTTGADPAGGIVLAAFVDADVTVSLWADGRAAGGDPIAYRLRCSAADGAATTEPAQVEGIALDAGVACAALATSPTALEPVPAGTACTELYGGPQELTVQGTVAGAPVDAALSRANGCEIARWDALAGLSGSTPGTSEPGAPTPGAESLAAQ